MKKDQKIKKRGSFVMFVFLVSLDCFSISYYTGYMYFNVSFFLYNFYHLYPGLIFLFFFSLFNEVRKKWAFTFV